MEKSSNVFVSINRENVWHTPISIKIASSSYFDVLTVTELLRSAIQIASVRVALQIQTSLN